jgi:hypothetical protein
MIHTNKKIVPIIKTNDGAANDDIEQPHLALLVSKTPLYVVGEGVFNDRDHLEKSRVARGDQTPTPPLEEMGYTPAVLAYLRSPKDISDRDLWP